jgi:hypothetical protein
MMPKLKKLSQSKTSELVKKCCVPSETKELLLSKS